MGFEHTQIAGTPRLFDTYTNFSTFVAAVYDDAVRIAARDSGAVPEHEMYACMVCAYPATLTGMNTAVCSLLAAGFRAHGRYLPPANGSREGSYEILFSPPSQLDERQLARAFRRYFSSPPL